MMDSSPFPWLEHRAPACHLIALIDDATSRVWGRLAPHDSTEENLRTLQGWLFRWGRPLALYSSMGVMQIDVRRTIHTAGRPWDQRASRGEQESNTPALLR
jgi:hypothetical protein